MPSGQGGKSLVAPRTELSTDRHAAGTNPIHNKQKKKAVKEEDEEDKAYKAKQAAGTAHLQADIRTRSLTAPSARQEGSRRDGEEGRRQGTFGRRWHQEKREEMR